MACPMCFFAQILNITRYIKTVLTIRCQLNVESPNLVTFYVITGDLMVWGCSTVNFPTSLLCKPICYMQVFTCNFTRNVYGNKQIRVDGNPSLWMQSLKPVDLTSRFDGFHDILSKPCGFHVTNLLHFCLCRPFSPSHCK